MRFCWHKANNEIRRGLGLGNSAGDINLTPNLSQEPKATSGATHSSTRPYANVNTNSDKASSAFKAQPQVPEPGQAKAGRASGYNSGDVGDSMPYDQDTDYWERPNGAAERKVLAGLVYKLDKNVFAHIRNVKEAVAGVFEKGNAVYVKACEEQGTQPNYTSSAFAAPMLARAGMSFVPDTPGEAAAMGIASAATKPLLFAGGKAYKFGAKVLGSNNSANDVKLAYNLATEGVARSASKTEGVFFSHAGGKTPRNTVNPQDRLQLEKLRTQYRQQANWVNPSEISDPKLQKIVNGLYRPNAKVASGSTADAVRVELSSTNIKIQGADHYQKAQDAIVGIEKLLGRDGLSAHDRMIAENVRLDLMDALGDKLWYSQTNIPKL